MLNELSIWDTINTEKYEETSLESSMYFPLNYTDDDSLKIENGIVIANLNVPQEFVKQIKLINLLFIKNQKDYIKKNKKLNVLQPLIDEFVKSFNSQKYEKCVMI